MISCENFARILSKRGIRFITGVPCSLFKDWLRYLSENDNFTHITASSEGEAIGIASGYHLATQKFGVVYLQNSGLGNCVNPLTSLADEKVYGIPILLMISWRGKPEEGDEPQHAKMGQITHSILDVLGIPYFDIRADKCNIEESVDKALGILNSKSKPAAIIFQRNTFKKFNEDICQAEQGNRLKKEEAIHLILNALHGKEVIVSTTGKTSRELFEIREELKQGHEKDFLTVGSMGCASSIGLGLALNSKRKVFVFDGDGAVLMKMGALATIGHYKPSNFFHIIFDNKTYDSTGGQPTVSGTVSLSEIANNCGYLKSISVSNMHDLTEGIKYMLSSKGPVCMVVKVSPGSRKNLGRPTTSPQENKKAFIDYL